MLSNPAMPYAPEAFVAIGASATPTFSRDGRTLFHLRGSGLPQVWALDLTAGTDRQLTFHDEKIALLRRSPVDDRLIYGFDRGGDERQQLMLLDPRAEPPEPRALTANHAVIHDFGGWSPDATQIAYAANERDEAHFDVYVQDIDTGVRRCVFQGTNIVSVFGFRADGAQLALVHDRAHADTSLLVLDLASGEANEFPSPSPSDYKSVRWASDGRALLALTDHGDSEFTRLCRLDPETADVTVVFAAQDRDVDAWAISPDARVLATVENDGGRSVLRVGPIDGERPEVTGLPRGIVADLAFSPDSDALAFVAASPTRPPSLWLWRDGAARCVWQPEPHIDPASHVDLELVSWESFDGRRIPGWLAIPRTAKPQGGHPAIIWVHGGPVGQTRPNFRPDIQMLLAQGFAVLLPNVRGSSGYGRAYTKSDDVGKRLDSVTDLAYGRHWLAAHPAIDGERIGIMGQSYGGFMVLSAITEHPDLWRAAVNYYGIADFVTLLAGTGAWRRAHRAAEYGDPERDADLFARISPIHRVDRVCAQLLVAHGTRDPRVPIGESEQFVAALRERQKPVTFLTFDYAGHGFVRPDDRRRIYAAIAEFFTTHLR
jgi:dipeptidyl aminopeptidase/acylaminoacyl peptidase